MADRQVTYTITLDDQFSGPLKRSIAELRREFNSLLADSRRGGMGGGPGPSAPAGSTSVSSARPGVGNFGAESHLKELVSRQGYTNRLLERISAQLGAGGSGGGGGGFSPGGGGGSAGPVTGRTWTQWGQQNRILPNDPRAWAGVKIGAGAIGHGIMTLGERWKAEAEGKMAVGIGAQDADLIDKAGAAEIAGKRVSVGGSILRGAAIGSVGGPIGTAAGAAVGAISDLDGLAESIYGVSVAAEEAKLKLNAISPADSRRRDFMTMSAVESSQREVRSAKFRASQYGDLDDSRVQGNSLEFARREAMAEATSKGDMLKKMGGASTNAGIAAEQAKMASEATAAAERAYALARQELDVKREGYNLDIKAAEVSRSRYVDELQSIQQQIRLKEREIQGGVQKFGQLNRFDQGRVGRIAKNFEEGKDISKQDEVFARGLEFFQRDFEKLDQGRARDSGLLTSDVRKRLDRSRGEQGDYTLEQLKGQEANIKARIDLASTVVVELNFDKAKAESQFKEDLVKPLVAKMEELANLFGKFDLGRIATSQGRKAASQ